MKSAGSATRRSWGWKEIEISAVGKGIVTIQVSYPGLVTRANTCGHITYAVERAIKITLTGWQCGICCNTQKKYLIHGLRGAEEVSRLQNDFLYLHSVITW
jgi:hypothetical protein